MNFAIFDIDGTIADCSWRNEHAKNARAAKSQDEAQRHWQAFHDGIPEDPVHPAEVLLARAWVNAGHRIIYVTGRPESSRKKTREWMHKNDVPCEETIMFMREPSLTKNVSSADFKRDMLIYIKTAVIREPKEKIWFAVEDDDRCVAMYREEGLTCLQPRKAQY